MIVNENGKSYPVVEMTINQLNYRKSRLESKNALGVWKAGMPGDIAFAAGQSLRPFKVVSVFKIAVVVVSKQCLCERVWSNDARWPPFSLYSKLLLL